MTGFSLRIFLRRLLPPAPVLFLRCTRAFMMSLSALTRVKPKFVNAAKFLKRRGASTHPWRRTLFYSEPTASDIFCITRFQSIPNVGENAKRGAQKNGPWWNLKRQYPFLKLPWGLLALCRRTLGIERHRYAIAWPDKLGTDPMAYGSLNK